MKIILVGNILTDIIVRLISLNTHFCERQSLLEQMFILLMNSTINNKITLPFENKLSSQISPQ